MEHLLERIVESSGLSQSALARRSGVSRSSLWRIQGGAVDPGVGTLRELAVAAGLDLQVDLVALSDPDAGRAARALLDARFEGPPDSGVREWIERLQRWVPDGDPVELVRVAGESSSLLHRRGATFLAGSVTELKLASAGSYSAEPWLLSGAAVLHRIGEPDTEEGSADPYVVYTANPHRFIRLLDHMSVAKPTRANLVIVQHTPDLEQDAWGDGNIRLVAPIQGLLDCFGLGGRLAAAALNVAGRW